MKRSNPLNLVVFGIVSTSTIAFAQLTSMRATIPGSLHQCEQTNLFLFDTGNTRPITIALLPSSRSPSSKSEMTLREAIGIGPLQMMQGIETKDNQAYDWKVSVAAGEEFETWGFFPDGNGKNLNLPRAVQTSLPGDQGKCTPSTTESSKPGPGIKKATSGRIYVGKAPPTFDNNGNTTEGAIVVGSPVSKIQTAVNAVSTSSTISDSVAASSTTSSTSESASEPSSTTTPSSANSEEKAQDSSSTNSASGQIIMKWLIGGLGVVASSLLV